MSEHRRRTPQSQQPQQPQYGGRRPNGPTSSGRGQSAAHPSGGMPPRRTARPQPGGGPAAGSPAEPRPTRAEMRRAAQGKGGGRGGSGGGGGGRGPGGPGGPGGRGGKGPNGPRPKRFIDYPRWGKTGFRRWLPSWKLVTSCFLFCFGSLTALVGYAYATVQMPSIDATMNMQANTYQWSNGKTMAVRGAYNRTKVPLGDVPTGVQNDFLAAENANFWTDSGVDPQGIARAVYKMASGGDVQSGSTITQQYLKIAFLGSQQTVSRKFEEIMLAVKLNQSVSKQNILEGYLNSVYFGRGAYGIEAAAKTYFNTDSKSLTVSQGAFLAALVNGPSLYDPAGDAAGNNVDANTARMKARWQWILSRQAADKMATAPLAQDGITSGFPKWLPRKTASTGTGYVGYLVDLADLFMTTHGGVTQASLDKGGYTIRTTFVQSDMDAMKAAVAEPFKGQYKLDPKRKVTNKDSITGKYNTYPVDAWLHVGGASVKPGDGAVTAIYGGPDYMKQAFDDANNPGVLVGSTFKAFVLAAALKDGVQSSDNQVGGGATGPVGVSLNSLYNGNDKLKIKNPDGTLWTDKNGPWTQVNDSGDNLGPINLKVAMARSINTVYVQLGMDVGMQNVKDAAILAGLNKDSNWGGLGPSFALGTSTPGPIRMATAYATFAASGMEADPYEVQSFVYNGATTVTKSKPHQVFSPDVADSVTTALKAVVQEPYGTGIKAQALGWDAAGKTGTTDSKKSAWFVGYTKDLSTAIGLWDVDPKSHALMSLTGLAGQQEIYGADFPTEIWTAYMEQALNGVTPVPLPGDPHYGTIQNEPGVSASPTAKPSASSSASSSASASSSPSTSASPSSSPSDSSSPCTQLEIDLGTCPNPSPSSSKKHPGGGGSSSSPAVPNGQAQPNGG
ncbi:membrane peptidoglycan carboxypeptidase [Streptacidiphilus sp. MAP12-33]|uniref:transglycosylase domain-containing protein n=1 Tax=Streptacidiphilus sp. MAP12-33 TaxID=3156266 RepID=UPI0035137349